MSQSTNYPSVSQKLKRVIGIRTHLWTSAENKLYQRLLDYFLPSEIFIVCESLKGKPKDIPSNIQVIFWDNEFLAKNKLINYHNHHGVGWMCGDYFYYALKQQVNADFYWLVEPDVLFNFKELSDFFGYFESKNEDAILLNYAKSTKDWYWYRSGELVSPNDADIYRCNFPLSRLSYKAIEHCLQERKRLSDIYIQANAFTIQNAPNGIHYPNDEVLVATTLKRDKLSIKSFNELLPAAFHNTGWTIWFSELNQDHYLLDNTVIYSIRNLEQISDRIIQELSEKIDKLDSISMSIISPNNIESISDNIAMKIKNKIQQSLLNTFNASLINRRKISVNSLVSFLKEKLSNHPSFDIDKHIWIYSDNIVVLDLHINSIILTLDFIFHQNYFSCESFERNVISDKWIKYLQSTTQNPNISLKKDESNRITLLQTQDIGTEKWLQSISDTVDSFYLQAMKFAASPNPDRMK